MQSFASNTNAIIFNLVSPKRMSGNGYLWFSLLRSQWIWIERRRILHLSLFTMGQPRFCNCATCFILLKVSAPIRKVCHDISTVEKNFYIVVPGLPNHHIRTLAANISSEVCPILSSFWGRIYWWDLWKQTIFILPFYHFYLQYPWLWPRVKQFSMFSLQNVILSTKSAWKSYNCSRSQMMQFQGTTTEGLWEKLTHKKNNK